MSDSLHRHRTLQAALAAFDRAHARRRLARRAAGSASVLALLSVAVAVAWPARQAIDAPPGAQGDAVPARSALPAAGRQLPSFVEIIRTDRDLAWELEVAGACEGIGRDGDRVFIVPCSASAS